MRRRRRGRPTAAHSAPQLAWASARSAAGGSAVSLAELIASLRAEAAALDAEAAAVETSEPPTAPVFVSAVRSPLKGARGAAPGGGGAGRAEAGG